MSTGTKFDGIWTSGIDYVIVDALKAANHPFVPIVGADNAGFVSSSSTAAASRAPRSPTRRPSVAPASTSPSRLLDGKKPADTTVHVTPEIWGNDDRRGQGRAHGRSRPEDLRRRGRSASRSRTGPRTPRTELIACKGPGEVSRPPARSTTGMPVSPASPCRH